MNNEVIVYHYTKKENLPSIFREGLFRKSNYHSLGSSLRNNANYFWLSPLNDGMGYKDNDEYECLQISVDSESCIVANMDLISAAFVNFIMEKKNEALYDYKKIAALYDSTAVKLKDYTKGLFRAPEAIVQGIVLPQQIKTAKVSANENTYTDNRDVYNARLINKNLSLALLQKIAVHDDSTGLLTTYKLAGKDEFVTIEELLECKFVR